MSTVVHVMWYICIVAVFTLYCQWLQFHFQMSSFVVLFVCSFIRLSFYSSNCVLQIFCLAAPPGRLTTTVFRLHLHMLTGAPIAILFPVTNTRLVKFQFIHFIYLLDQLNHRLKWAILIKIYLSLALQTLFIHIHIFYFRNSAEPLSLFWPNLSQHILE